MDKQKDNQKETPSAVGISPFAGGEKSFISRQIYDFVNKKTEKLVTALYMVTDCMETDDALKAKLRFLGVELLSDMYKLASLSMIEKHTHLGISVSRISEILSFVDIASTIGFISEMNANILKREFLPKSPKPELP